MSKHTPGPWHLEVAEDDSGRIKHFVPADSEKQSLLTVVEWDGVKFAAVYLDADARLIAAAPELLEALLLFQRQGWLNDHHCAGDDGNRAIAFARAAIAKATGETK